MTPHEWVLHLKAEARVVLVEFLSTPEQAKKNTQTNT